MIKKNIILSLIIIFPFFANAQKKILFDNTKSETAGNADWIIDTSEPVPTPAQSGITSSTSETYWKGGISSWGIEMVKRGFYVETLPSYKDITYGNSSNSMDLSNYDVYVVCEPNNPFTSSEKTAIMNFVQNGGGLFMVADHEGADRDGDGWDAYAIWRDLITNNSVQNNAFGMIFDVEDYINDYPCNNVANRLGDPLLHGIAGNVTGMEFHGSTAMSINTTYNPTVKAAIYKDGVSNTGTSYVMAAYAEYGQGKVVGLVDSSPADDGTGDNGDNLYDGWNELDNGTLITNATLWLAEKSVGVENVNNESLVHIYPNPTNGNLNIEFSSAKITYTNIILYDITGHVLETINVNEKQVSIDTKNYSKGLYFIELSNENNKITKKIIIN